MIHRLGVGGSGGGGCPRRGGGWLLIACNFSQALAGVCVLESELGKEGLKFRLGWVVGSWYFSSSWHFSSSWYFSSSLYFSF